MSVGSRKISLVAAKKLSDLAFLDKAFRDWNLCLGNHSEERDRHL